MGMTCQRSSILTFSSATWIRDSSFTLYALIRLGFTSEANGEANHCISLTDRFIHISAFMEFIFERLRNKEPDGSLQIMFTIHGMFPFADPKTDVDSSAGEKDLEEIELSHLDGHKGSKPVRIGNGAADHLQLDIYGEL